MIYSAHCFSDFAEYKHFAEGKEPLAIDIIGATYFATTLDEQGEVLTAGAPKPGYYVNAVWQNGIPVDWQASQIPNTEAPRWWSGVPRDPAPPPALTPEAVAAAVDAIVEAAAHSMDYKSVANCISYVNSQNPAWAAEAQALSAYRDGVWLAVYTIDLKAPPHSIEEVFAVLPQFTRPDHLNVGV